MIFYKLVLLFLVATCQGRNLPDDDDDEGDAPRVKPVERPLKVGAFNVQNLGNSKFANKEVMDVVKKIILEYDLILIQELVTLKPELIHNLVSDLNKLAKAEIYEMALSVRLGRGNAKEQYAYIYRSDRLALDDAHEYPDKDDLFMRPPYIAKFNSPTTMGLSTFLAIGIHTQPKAAANETSHLSRVYDYAAKHYSVEDAIIMGDMNAGCSNVRISDWPNIELWARPEFTWLIGHDVDTTIAISGCPYDRIVIAGENIKKNVVEESASIFNYRDKFHVNSNMILNISDHWPVQVLFRGRVSTLVARNLNTRMCFTMEDKRKVEDPSALHSADKKYGFDTKILLDENGNEVSMTATLDRANLRDLTSKLADISSQHPDIIRYESLEATLYKIEFGALEDASSFQSRARPSYSAKIECDLEAQQCSTLVCVQTLVN